MERQELIISKTYLCLNTPKLYIINDYKVGTRFVNSWFNKQHMDQVPNQIPQMGSDDKLWVKILNRKKINKNILMIYRNPLEKTITGLLEDFSETIIRGNDPQEYKDALDNINDHVHFKILKSLTFSNEENSYKFDEVFSNEFIYDTPIKSADVFTSLFTSYVDMRRKKVSLNDKHAKYHICGFYFLVNEFLRDVQDFTLFNIDNKDIQLHKVLSKYKKPPKELESTSNLKYKKLLTEDFWNSDIFKHIKNDMEDEILFYHAMKESKFNIINTDEKV
jgi:hypothetical protein